MTFRRIFAPLLLTVAMGAPVGAQTEQPTIMRMMFVRLKADQVDEWASSLRDRQAILKKAGAKHAYSIWTSLTGDMDIVRVDLFSKWADLDTEPYSELTEQAADLDRIQRRLLQCQRDQKRVIGRILTDASLPFPQEMPAMLVFNTVQAIWGKGSEFEAMVKSELLPLVGKGGIKYFYTARVGVGAPIGTYQYVFGIPNWAAADNPVPFVGPDYQRYRGKRDAVITSRVENYYRFRADLSYLPQTNASR